MNFKRKPLLKGKAIPSLKFSFTSLISPFFPTGA